MLRLKHQRLQNEQIQSALRKFDTLRRGHASLSLLQEEYTISCRSARGSTNRGACARGARTSACRVHTRVNAWDLQRCLMSRERYRTATVEGVGARADSDDSHPIFTTSC